MKKSLLLSAALVATLQIVPVEVAHAQGVHQTEPNTRAARRAREQAKNPAANIPQKYPKATRESPKQAGEPALARTLNSLIELQGKEGVDAEIIAKADSILGNSRANAFDKSTAAYLAGSAAMSLDSKDNATPARYFRQAIELGGLDNNNHYLAMLQLAQVLDADGKHEEALTWVDRFLSETQSDDSTALAIKNQVLLSMDKPELALEFLEKQAAAKPDDTRMQMNLASTYLEAGKEAQAIALLEKLSARASSSRATTPTSTRPKPGTPPATPRRPSRPGRRRRRWARTARPPSRSRRPSATRSAGPSPRPPRAPRSTRA